MSASDIERELSKIAGNKAVIEKLHELIESGEALALVGAGASAGLWPLWDGFLQGFIDYGLKCGKVNKSEADYFREETPKTPLETAQQLRNKIGENLYFEYIQETFKDKTYPATGGAYTLAHKALMQLPIWNYITLNYDAGLTNARAALHPNATTTYFFWDQEEARRVREREYRCQVLHAHGRHDRADSIILTLNDYQRAYGNRAFVRLLNDIFAFEKLLIVGCGFGDPRIKELFANINADYKKSPLRHIAFVGLKDDETQIAHLQRERVEMMYGARILFYPARDHHRALTEYLATLAEQYAEMPTNAAAEEIQAVTPSPQLKKALADKYVHKPTDDANFKGRTLDFDTLNRWGNDLDTRIIAVTGIGGQGKTALVGRWLKQERPSGLAERPVFYWSFYEDLDVGKFLEEVVEFLLPIVHINGEDKIDPISFVRDVSIQVPFLLVLDGLEVLQEEADRPEHGRINQQLLEQFVLQWVRQAGQGLMILTSRFQFPQLNRYSGVGFHHLNLERLRIGDGVALLDKLNVLGDWQLKGTYVEKLHGHPLALRVLASTVKRCCQGDLAEFQGNSILAAIDEEDDITKKLKHMLAFHESGLKDGQKELLGIISLFKRPVEIESFVTLLRGMKSLEKTPLAKASADEIERQLDLLVDDFLVEKTREGSITTHPVIRDYFRSGLKIAGSRREVADFLKARPGGERPQTIEEVRDLVEAVQLLCEEGEYKAARDLVKARLSEGGYGYDAFQALPAVQEGLECYTAFICDERRVREVGNELGEAWIGAFYSGIALFNLLLGNMAAAQEWYDLSLEIALRVKVKVNQSITLAQISQIEMSTGSLQNALSSIARALDLAQEIKALDQLSVTSVHKAYYEFLTGDSGPAYHDFELALCWEQALRPDLENLYSIWGRQEAEFLIRLGVWKLSDAVNTWNIKICENSSWNRDLAICRQLQGWSHICRWQLTDAAEELGKAERILRPSGMAERICRLDWTWGLLAEAKGDYNEGLRRGDDALAVCADKGFRLWQADALVLRGRLRLMQFQKEECRDKELLEKAGDDGYEALKIAEQTGYVWPKVEALELLARYHQARAEVPDYNPSDEKEQAVRRAKEAKSIKAGLMLTEDQMKKIKVQAREEFTKMTAGWADKAE